MSRSARVLVVDDDPIVCDVLSRYLAREGFDVSVASDGEQALAAVKEHRPDLVVLDLMLPRLDGLEVFRRIRADGSPAVIMLTARGDETDRVVGLEVGADDYITKPFSPREVVARVRAVLRRTGQGDQVAGSSSPQTLRFGDVTVEVGAREVRRAGSLISLTPKEFDVLMALASHPGRVLTRLEILEEVWDFAFAGDPATVTVHLRRLRRKLEADPSTPRHLVTAWGVGYRFVP